MARNRYSFSQTGETTGRPGFTSPKAPVGSCERVANAGVLGTGDCCDVPKACNWTTLPFRLELTADTEGTVTIVSPIAPFFDIHAASMVVVQAEDCTLNGRAVVRGVEFNSTQLEDYSVSQLNLIDPEAGVLIDAAYMFDAPTAVNWAAGTQGNNQALAITIRNICDFDVVVYGVLYGNPCHDCPL
jgi:hypothetical protein